jgi:hypothetical protein
MRLLAPILIVLLSTSLGCPIMDELNKANDKMDEIVKTKPKKDEDREADASTKLGPLERSKQWWKSARSLDSDKVSPSIVTCRVGGRSQFMSRDECLSRGGNPGRASG